MSAHFDPATTEESVRLGDAITDWTWTWIEKHPRAHGPGAMFQRDLTAFIDGYLDDVDTKQARHLARDICWWARVWQIAADRGYADLDFGMEWRHSLMRYLALTDEQRHAWLGQPYEQKLEDVHIAGGLA